MKKNYFLNFEIFACTLFSLVFANSYAQVYTNGNLSTGATSKSGVAAPSGYTWSEMQNDTGNTTESNGTTGVGAQIVGTTTSNRVADDFTVPVGQSWTLSKITFYAYQTGYAGTTSPFTTVRVRISNGNPSVGTPTVVFGDMTTNRLLSTSDALMYRIANSTTPSPGTVPGTTRKIWKIEATVNVTLAAGTYWVEWQQDAGANGNFSPPSTILNARTQPGYNAIQFTTAWAVLSDSGSPATAPDVAVDMPFVIDYVQLLGTDQNEFSSKVALYPNPAKNTLTISDSSNSQDASIEITDISGRIVKLLKTGFSNEVTINVSELTSGNYILKLKSENGTAIKKFIKI